MPGKLKSTFFDQNGKEVVDHVSDSITVSKHLPKFQKIS